MTIDDRIFVKAGTQAGLIIGVSQASEFGGWITLSALKGKQVVHLMLTLEQSAALRQALNEANMALEEAEAARK